MPASLMALLFQFIISRNCRHSGPPDKYTLMNTSRTLGQNLEDLKYHSNTCRNTRVCTLRAANVGFHINSNPWQGVMSLPVGSLISLLHTGISREWEGAGRCSVEAMQDEKAQCLILRGAVFASA